MKKKELNTLLAYWQRELRLQDWLITVRLVGRDEMGEGSDGWQIGRNEPCSSEMCSEIKILRSAHKRKDYPRGCDQDEEVTLVHELLHLTFPSGGEKKRHTPNGVLLEQGLVRTSQALVKLRRQAWGETDTPMSEAVNKWIDFSMQKPQFLGADVDKPLAGELLAMQNGQGNGANPEKVLYSGAQVTGDPNPMRNPILDPFPNANQIDFSQRHVVVGMAANDEQGAWEAVRNTLEEGNVALALRGVKKHLVERYGETDGNYGVDKPDACGELV